MEKRDVTIQIVDHSIHRVVQVVEPEVARENEFVLREVRDLPRL